MLLAERPFERGSAAMLWAIKSDQLQEKQGKRIELIGDEVKENMLGSEGVKQEWLSGGVS